MRLYHNNRHSRPGYSPVAYAVGDKQPLLVYLRAGRPHGAARLDGEHVERTDVPHPLQVSSVSGRQRAAESVQKRELDPGQRRQTQRQLGFLAQHLSVWREMRVQVYSVNVPVNKK